MRETKDTAQQLIKKHSGDINHNPYLQSRALWLDIYGDAESRYRKSRRLNFYLLTAMCLCILGIIYMGSKSKFIPYLVELKDGLVVHAEVAKNSNFSTVQPKLATFFIQEFIQSARSVSVDGYIEKNYQQKAYAFTQGPGTTELNAFYKAHDPYEIVKKRTISVSINYVNRLPTQAFQVGWMEISHDSQTGDLLSQKRYVGEFEFKWDKPSQSTFILKHNPFGFYITNISWTGVAS
ncbi:MAG: type IV secretion system protein [Gammaproteobacteria bacterium]|nr:type IV secretion system protein [Gammaproteobacteria bacterium]